MGERVYLYDSTLRDGAQARGVDFTVADKLAIARELDMFGIDYIEGGWPGANTNDDLFFASPPTLTRAKLAAFGMTRRSGRSVSNDPGLAALLAADTSSLCLVGKAWDRQVEKALGVSRKENLRMIGESLLYARERGREILFDAEHFFDGYRANPDYALAVIETAYAAGCRWVVLCDTNGGALPSDISRILAEAAKIVPGTHLGIHCHNDTDQAVACSLAAVEAGARQVQGTINGIGERCGNANLVSILPTLMLKLGFETGVPQENLASLTRLSRFVDERLGRAPHIHAPYVGSAAFAHKGGLHVSAMAKDTSSYEHIDPLLVGNRRTILVSDKAGRANILERLKQMGIDLPPDHPHIAQLVSEVKEREAKGYAYEGAEASFELLAHRLLGDMREFFTLQKFRVLDERRWDAKGRLVTVSEATVKLSVGEESVMTVAEGNGPVNALDSALRQALLKHYPSVMEIRLTDYKVRILTPQAGTAALTRVMIESRGAGDEKVWNTIGVSANVIDASFNALYDAITYWLRAG
jgi:2-isopropylmalate synthase